jgi:hypothetical protein
VLKVGRKPFLKVGEVTRGAAGAEFEVSAAAGSDLDGGLWYGIDFVVVEAMTGAHQISASPAFSRMIFTKFPYSSQHCIVQKTVNLGLPCSYSPGSRLWLLLPPFTRSLMPA